MINATSGRSERTAFAALLASLLVVYALALATNRVDLHPDEAQYAVWARDPAFGYYSKPPMIAWSIAVLRAVCGEGEACVRLTGSLLQAGAAVLVAYAGTLLADVRIGALAGIVYATLPMTVFSSLFVTTDAPLCFFAAAALVFAVRALRTDAWIDWLGLGASFGLGLMSKYSMGVMVLAWLAYLAAAPRTRRLILSQKHLGAALLALALFAPNLAWNAAHGFPTLRHTAELARVARPAFDPRELGLFVLGQVGVLGPLLALLLARRTVAARTRLGDEPYRLPASLFLAPLAFFAALALVSRANANWTAFALAPAAVLAALLAAADGRERFLRAAIVVNLVVALGFAFLPQLLRVADVGLKGAANPLARVTGWRTLGGAVRARLADSPGLTIMADERLTAAELLYYARSDALVVWNPDRRVTDHFRLMNDIAASPAANVLFVTRASDRSAIERSFESVLEERPIEVDMGRAAPVTFRVYRATGFTGYPPR